MILRVIEEIRPPRFVLAHLGGWNDWEAVERELCGAPVFLDTALVFSRVVASLDGQGNPVYSQPIEDGAFVRMVRRHGVERVLFGTDSPWADQREYVRKMQSLPMTDAEKERILWQNAAQLLQIV